MIKSKLEKLSREIVLSIPLKLKTGDKIIIKHLIIGELFSYTVIDNSDGVFNSLSLCIEKRRLKYILTIEKEIVNYDIKLPSKESKK